MRPLLLLAAALAACHGASDAVCAADSCHGHGTCAVAGAQTTCDCAAGWAGSDCAACAPGRVQRGGACVPDCSGARRDLDVTVTNPDDGVALPGTLSLPGCSTPVPGVVLIHGSGPESRDEALSGSLLYSHPEVSVFGSFAQALVSAGLAVVRYDKRSCIAANSDGRCPRTSFGFDTSQEVVDEYAADAEAAIALLRARPEIDPSRIVVLGHSEGTTVAVRVAHDDTAIAAVVLVGVVAPDDPVASFYDQERLVVKYLQAQAPSAGLQQQIAQLQQQIAQGQPKLEGIAAGTYSGSLDGVPAKFWRSWLQYETDMKTLLPQLSQPVLVLTGELDFNLPPAPNLENVRRWRAGHAADAFVQVARANHLLVAPDEATLAAPVSPAALTAMTSWLGERLGLGTAFTPPEDTTSAVMTVRDELLCALRGTACDNAALAQALTADLAAAATADQLVAGVAAFGAGRGGLQAADTMAISVFAAGGTLWLSQDDRLAFGDGSARLVRTSFVAGPRLGGVHYP